MKFLTAIFILIFIMNGIIISYSQTWFPISSGTDREVRCLFTDTIANLLYVGGGFKMAGGISARGIAQWDGASWSSLGSGIDDSNLTGYPNNVLTITNYSNLLYVGGAFSTAGGILSPSLALWDGNAWIAQPFNINAAIYYLGVFGNQLIIGGPFTEINNTSAFIFASYNGVSIQSPNLGIDTLFIGYGITFTYFNNECYFGGNMLFNQNRDLLRWDSTSSGIYPMGIQGGISFINTMVIYKNELYIAGHFWKSDGNVGDNIMKWDGMNFSEVGGGTNGQIDCIKIINGDLYAGGTFTLAGSIPVTNIARWDGVAWHALNNTNINNGISCMEVYNNELYIGGGFTMINNVPINRIAKYDGLQSVNKLSVLNFDVYPNPSKKVLNIQTNGERINQIILEDIFGKKIYSKVDCEINCALDISLINSGLYFIVIKTKKGSVVKKFVKE